MAAYRWVDGWMTYGHLQADCLYTGISSGPNARCRVLEAFTFTFTFTFLQVQPAIERVQALAVWLVALVPPAVRCPSLSSQLLHSCRHFRTVSYNSNVSSSVTLHPSYPLAAISQTVHSRWLTSLLKQRFTGVVVMQKRLSKR